MKLQLNKKFVLKIEERGPILAEINFANSVPGLILAVRYLLGYNSLCG